MRRGLPGFLVLVVLGGRPATAQDLPAVHLEALLDARFARTGGERGWLDTGLGKTRYGAGEGGARSVGRLSQASALLGLDLTHSLRLRAQVNVDGEPHARSRRGRVDLVEGYVQLQPEVWPVFRLRARAGTFFPPISLEHDGTAWTSTYTITPSAVNTWIGEEVRATGAELTLGLGRGRYRLTAVGGLFGWNDPTGTLLAWRGWALHDRQTGWPDRLPVAPLPALGPQGPFPLQAAWDSPLEEVDGRAGFYAGTEARLFGRLRLRALRYDNNGDGTRVDDGQYAWATRMDAVGLALELPAGAVLLAQHMRGTTTMGLDVGGLPMVGVEPRASYVLLSGAAGRHRLTLRWDTFEVDEDDALPALDDNREDGTAWTAAYLLRVGERHRLALELLSVESTRPARAALSEPVRTRETLVQASLRLHF